jgi:hypothetical protein
VPASGSGYVTRFKVRREFLSRYPIQQAGGQQFQEYWIPADDLAEFNSNIVDIIEIAREFRREEKAPCRLVSIDNSHSFGYAPLRNSLMKDAFGR